MDSASRTRVQHGIDCVVPLEESHSAEQCLAEDNQALSSNRAPKRQSIEPGREKYPQNGQNYFSRLRKGKHGLKITKAELDENGKVHAVTFGDALEHTLDMDPLEKCIKEGQLSRKSFNRTFTGRFRRSLRFHSPSAIKLRKSISLWRKRTRYLIPILLLVIYSASGGLLFWLLEGGRQPIFENERALRAKLANETTNYTLTSMMELIGDIYYARIMDSNGGKCKEPDASSCCITTKQLLNVRNDIDVLADTTSLRTLLSNYTKSMNLLRQENRREWTFWGSIFYCGTVYTTIGYGYMTAETRWGRVLTVVYALFGIPLVLYNLSQLGSLLMGLIWRCYIGAIRLWGIVRGRRRARNTLGKKDMAEFPFWIAISITIGWTLMCSALFQIWEEDWDFFTSFYFFFQSLTTIGFGDVQPSYPERLVWSFFLILIGLSLVSMCWSLLQMKFDHMIRTASGKITERFISTEMDDGEMTTDATAIEQEIGKITSSENGFLANLVGDGRRQVLVNEWRKRAKMKHVACGTDAQQDAKATQTEEDGLSNLSERWNVPYRETRRGPTRNAADAAAHRPYNDDFRDLLRNIKNILGECRDTLSSKESPTRMVSSSTQPAIAANANSRIRNTPKITSSTSVTETSMSMMEL